MLFVSCPHYVTLVQVDIKINSVVIGFVQWLLQLAFLYYSVEAKIYASAPQMTHFRSAAV